jgi:hypothetical protein
MSVNGIFAPDPWYNRKKVATQVENVWTPRIGNISCIEDRACEAIYDLLGEEEVVYVNKLNHAPKKKFVKNVNILVWILEQILGCFCGKVGQSPSRPKLDEKINVISYSAGVATFNQMLIYLHENNIGYLNEKVKKGEKLTDEEIRVLAGTYDKDDIKYKKRFPCVNKDDDKDHKNKIKESGKSLSDSNHTPDKKQVHLSPSMFDKIVFISGPFEGVERATEGLKLDPKSHCYTKYSVAWFASLIGAIHYKLIGDTTGYVPSVYLGQYDKVLNNFVNDGKSIWQDLVDITGTTATSIKAFEIIKLYKLNVMRVVTTASVRIGEVYYFRPDSALTMYACWLFGSRLFTRKHDGVIAVKSQSFGLNCSCIDAYNGTTTTQCKKCNTVVCPVDHETIYNNGGWNQNRDEAWAYINYFLEH